MPISERCHFRMKQASTWVLLACVLFLLTVTTTSAVAHELRHATHHNAGMHGTGLCAWMCAAGQALTGHHASFSGVPEPCAVVEQATPRQVVGSSPNSFESRGPPRLLLLF